ncbi:EAL domain-containing protein [Lysobacter korlensis]|uniref:EAL domain-containing protein n=1 Tax=Lysobacter korlensis TaxID=553636 RepID=A0ABV6RKV8_9GAMM
MQEKQVQKAVFHAWPDRDNAACALVSLAAGLRHTLPRTAEVAVYWRDPAGEVGCSLSDGAAPLSTLAAQILHSDEPVPRASHLLIDAWHEEDGTHSVIVASMPEPLIPAAFDAWSGLARRVVWASLTAARAQAHVALLRKSERLQQALYEIADLAGSDLELGDVLRRLHGVVGGLMFAENFYIVSYDDVRERMRFLYFADQRDPYVADPDEEIGADDLPHSLTLALLRHGAPLRGPTEAIREQIGLAIDDADTRMQVSAAAGPESLDWLGVPMLREERVVGAVVVQSYDRAECYSDEDRALLAFVAQHIQTALDRHQAREELERRVQRRTEALWQSNRDLQGEIIERQRAERLQRALFRIAELSITSETLERFYAHVHDIVDELLYARNFYIALLTPDGTKLEFPYSVDERDIERVPRQRVNGLTEYVIDRGEPLLAERSHIRELEAEGAVRSVGALSHCWLGVPLRREDAVVGCIAVQSYSPEILFTSRDQELLTFVAHHIGIGLARKQAQDRLIAAHAELEQRVAARTHELAQTNAQLIAQIGERVRAEKQLTHQALHDPLTQLPNRTQLLKRLARAIERARSEQGAGFAVLFLDLDRFKLINDSAGHAAGDKLLVEVSRRIVETVRANDTVARLGGDEFAIVIEDLDNPELAEELAGRMLTVLGAPCWIAGRELYPSASIGIARWHPRYKDGAEMLRDADAAMYRAKGSGRNDWAVFDEAMREDAMRILDLEADLRRAIIGSGFIAFYQPIVRLADGKVIGHEALLRWRHERRGLLMPGEFIGLGEDSGLIEEVDWLVYEQVAHRLAATSDGYISVNVSPRHFRSDDFADRMLDLLAYAGADPHRLRIEITEVALLDDAPRALRMLQELRDKGVLAQLDDFGTGYSALSYLHRFPIECLKIDRSFVAGLVGESRAESIAVVRAIQALANALGIHTVGEGIETEAQRRILAELGCSHGQGFLFGHSIELPDPEQAALEPVP